MTRVVYPRPLAFVEELGHIRWGRRHVRLVGDPARHVAAHIAALDAGHIPSLRRTHGDDAPAPIYDTVTADLGPVTS